MIVRAVRWAIIVVFLIIALLNVAYLFNPHMFDK